MSNELQVLPGNDTEITVGAWCDEAGQVIARLVPQPPPSFEVLIWRGGPRDPAPRSAALVPGEIATIRLAGAGTGGVELVIGASLVDLDLDDDDEARFVREHACPWEFSMCTVPCSPERDRFVAAALAIAAARLLDGVIVNDNHRVIPLELATGPQWEAWLAAALDAELQRPADFEALADWYARYGRPATATDLQPSGEGGEAGNPPP